MNYKIVNHENKSFILVPELEELGLKHCFTTIDMDLGTKTNKSIESIRKNLRIAYGASKISPDLLYSGHQVHSGNVEVIGNKREGEENAFGRYFPNTDGLITSEKDLALISKYADCIPLIIFDPIKMVHANIHSGWKGTLERIGINGLDLLKKEYKSNPEDIIIVMGPAIGKEDFEVEKDVMEMFRSSFDFSEEVIIGKNKDKYLIDLKEIYYKLFLREGIKKGNIINIDLSTYSTPFLHSYRRDGSNFGLMGVITCLS